MKLDITFEESNQRIDVQFAEAQIASDGGFERGYEQGYTEGNENGYKNGYFEGQEQSASLFGIQNEVTGAGIVTCDYVNENEHNVEVKLSSDTVADFSGMTVKKIETNLFDKDNPNIINCYISDRIVKSNGYATIWIPCMPNTDYTVSKKIVSKRFKIAFFNSLEDGSFCGDIQANNDAGLSVSCNSGYNRYLCIWCYTTNETVTLDEILDGLQIEYGNVATPYKPYTETTYTANADGTVDGVTSISPVMNIICEGVNISAKYYCVQDAEWHRFWDDYQKQGTLENYSNLFAGAGWTVKTFKPKYDINPKSSGSTNIFAGNLMKIDLAEHLDSLNIKLDLSQAINSYSTFQNACFTRLPLLDMRLCTILSLSFANTNFLEIIDELIVNENCIFTNTFMQCTALRFIKMSGKIGKSINFQWSGLLSVESAKSIILCLANLIDTNPLTQTITFHDDVWAKLDAEGNTSPNGNTWRDYIADIGWLDS